MWLIALVWGWYRVGTHHSRRKSVTDTLEERVRSITLSDGSTADQIDYCLQGIKIKTSNPHVHRAQTIYVSGLPRQQHSGYSGSINTSSENSVFSIGGDELLDGPFYNYARCGTWSYIANSIIQGYSNSLLTNDAPSARDTGYETAPRDAIELADASYENVEIAPYNFEDDERLIQQFPRASFDNTAMDIRYAGPVMKCKFDHSGRLRRFGWKMDDRLKNLRAHIWATKALAFGIASALQSITAWAAFMIAYNTPTIGIGCRSFVYMTYSLVSIFCCILLIFASEFSDSECYRREINSMNQTADPKPNALLATVAICCRFLGRIIAILNSIFVVLSCIFEFAGVYQSCFCKSSRIGLGSAAYITFLTTEQSVDIARPYWIAGAGVPMFVVIVIGIGYFELTKEK
jgi:hypothetical protein